MRRGGIITGEGGGMKWVKRHPWQLTPKDAIQLQRQLRERVVRTDAFSEIRYVAGADAAFSRSDKLAYGAVVVYEYPSLTEVERAWAARPLEFPYVPGLLSFRELPVLLEAFAKLRHSPDLLIFDAHGIAHPRRCGLASHAGLTLNKPSIGCAKSRLVGSETATEDRAGAWTELTDEGEVIGATLRTRLHSRPVYVSIGHRVALETAIAIVLKCCDGPRIPKPTREADGFVAQVKRMAAGKP
jgi:deoxyribonuclease V